MKGQNKEMGRKDKIRICVVRTNKKKGKEGQNKEMGRKDKIRRWGGRTK